VTDSYRLSAHIYADDTQVYGFCRPTAATALTANITDCVEATTSSMRSQQASDKTELLWCATARRQHQLATSPLLIDGCSITPLKSSLLADLGIYVDCDLSMRTHVLFLVKINIGRVTASTEGGQLLAATTSVGSLFQMCGAAIVKDL